MKSLTIALIVGTLSAPCFSMDSSELSKEIAYTILHVTDWEQTRTIAREPQWVEKNLILGAKPSQAKVNGYMGATLAAHWGISLMLKGESLRLWQDGTIALEASTVHRNHRLGVRVSW